MAKVRELASGETTLVEPEHTFGRAPTSSVRIDTGYVSAQHAALRWSRGRWVLRDLGSRNGTYLNGERLGVREERHVRVGMTFSLGKPNINLWEMVDEAPPSIMAVPVDGGQPVVMIGEFLAVPSSDEPQVTIYRGSEVQWLIERADEATTTITNLQTFTAGAIVWRFCCPDEIGETTLASNQHELEVRHLQLAFSVSRDEEHVALRLTCGGRMFEMGSRAHNYLLLTLARRRLEDAANAIPESSCGWVYQEDLIDGLQLAGPSHLNLDVYRLRRQFGAAGVADAANIIERRPRTRQLRIGTSYLSIVRL
jgi:hypothetical protein